MTLIERAAVERAIVAVSGPNKSHIKSRDIAEYLGAAGDDRPVLSSVGGHLSDIADETDAIEPHRKGTQGGATWAVVDVDALDVEPEAVTDGGQEIDGDGEDGADGTFQTPDTDLTRFQLEVLYTIADTKGEPHGLAIKEELEELYDTEVHHGRLYPNLDTLVEKGLVAKGTVDDRTNSYTLTEAGKQEVRRDAQRRFGIADGLGGDRHGETEPEIRTDGGVPEDSESVPVDELRELADGWASVYRDFLTLDGDYSDGVAEGARSAALELRRLVGRHTETDQECDGPVAMADGGGFDITLDRTHIREGEDIKEIWKATVDNADAYQQRGGDTPGEALRGLADEFDDVFGAEPRTDGGTQGAIDNDYDDGRREFDEDTADALDGVQTAPMQGGIAIDLVTRQPLFVRRVVADDLAEYYEDEEFNLLTYKTHPYLPVRKTDRVFECVFVSGQPEGAHKPGDTYDFPEGRLMHYPVEQAWGGGD